MSGTITFTSLAVSEGTGDTMMILTASGSAKAGDEGSASFSNISIQLKGKVLEDGNLEINAVKLDKQGTLEYTDEDGDNDTIDLSSTDVPDDVFEVVSLDKALVLTPTGFTYEASGSDGELSGSGKVTGVLSGNTLTLTGEGSGSGSEGVGSGKGTLTLTRR